MFLDESRISVKGGAGGNGCAAFRREKYEPFGGPNGGDGGRGGHVILEASAHLHTLFDVGSFRTYRGERGQHGMGSNCTGRNGEDAVVRVPVGTIVKSETGEVLADLSEPGQTFIAAKGGRGGAGNQHFATARHQKPTRAYPGFPGEERVLNLELKLVADVGLVGFPNAGKSSLLTALSKATPKIADYPFTTLEPALGIVPVGNYASIVMADIPGLIEGASQGKGLGHRFLRHIERTRSLLFVLDPWSQGGETPEERLEQTRTMLDVLRGELGAYHARLLEKPWRVALNKSDLGEPFPAEWMPEALPISAAAHLGLPELVDTLWKAVENETDRNRITVSHEYLELPDDVPDWYKPGENG